MTKEIETQLKNWGEHNSGNPCDDNRLYDIVLQTLDEKIHQDDFKSIAGEANYNKYFFVYEHLVDFAKYYQKQLDNK